jgi:hypothetical protein
MYTTLNGKKPRAEGGGRQNPLYDTKKRRLLLNEHIKQKPKLSLISNYSKAEELLKAGFEL